MDLASPWLPDVSLTWVLAGILPVLFYVYYIRPLSLFQKMGVPGPRPWPILGGFLSMMLRGFWDPDHNVRMLRQYGEYYGVFSGSTPMLLVSDPDMLREILVKQFHNFSRRTDPNMNINTTPTGRMLLNLDGDEWKNVRTTLTPAFSSGKLKQMSAQLNRCADVFAETIGGFARSGKSFKARELTGGFTMDAIASTAFGTEIDSQRNPDDPFVTHGKEGFKFNFKDPVMFLFILFPRLLKPILEAVNYDFFPWKSYKFFESVFDQLMALRQHGGVERVDFLQLMANAHKDTGDDDSSEVKVQGHRKALTKADVISNGILFFLAGYDTTSLTMAYTMYNLALHRDAQEAVIQEVGEAMEGKEDVDQEALGRLTYLEMCIMETLRLYPPGANVMNRSCVHPTTVKGVSIPENLLITVPIQAIHYDPERWPEPEKFIPERFTKEEREKRNPFHWLPFGAGPRNCIGMRLALMEAKIGLAKVFKKYRILPCTETQVPLKMKKHEVFPIAEDGVVLRAELIDKAGD